MTESDRSGAFQCQSHTKNNSGNKQTNVGAKPNKLPIRSMKEPGGGWQTIGLSLPKKPKDSASGSKKQRAPHGSHYNRDCDVSGQDVEYFKTLLRTETDENRRRALERLLGR